MPVCGNCGKDVSASDVTCPHCGVLLAAYTSPVGAGAAEFHVPSAEPSPTDIPNVDLNVPPPSETHVITDPNEVTEEVASTAPKPLFDTRLTVEEIARAAESEHDDDVVTISEKKIAIKRVEFDVPDYARPPKDAAPIPIVEDADAAIPVITHDSAIETENEAPKPGGESWLNDAHRPTPKPKPRKIRQDPPKVAPEPAPARTLQRAESRSESREKPPGQTDAYLRELHEKSGYVPETDAISAPVSSERPTQVERARQRAIASQNMPTSQSNTAVTQSMQIGCTALYVIFLVMMWAVVLVTLLTGGFSTGLIFFVLVLTMGFKPIRKAIGRMSSS